MHWLLGLQNMSYVSKIASVKDLAAISHKIWKCKSNVLKVQQFSIAEKTKKNEIFFKLKKN